MDEKTPWHFLSGGLGAVAGLIGGYFGASWLADRYLRFDPLAITAVIAAGIVCGGWLGAKLGVRFVDLLYFAHALSDNRRRSRERRSSPDTIRDSLDLDR
jgi:hypothetical protein